MAATQRSGWLYEGAGNGATERTGSLGRPGEASWQAPWGVILAGGDGVRLRSLTRRITGDERPKQFCPILGHETLLNQTRRRTALTVSPDRTLVVVTRAHERFYTPVLAGPLSSSLVVQPENRGTAPAILYALHRLAPMTGTATDFSSQVLERHPARLAVLRVSGVGWNDLGDPHRVEATQRQMYRRPHYAWSRQMPAELSAR